jgi:hypothetical protein
LSFHAGKALSNQHSAISPAKGRPLRSFGDLALAEPIASLPGASCSFVSAAPSRGVTAGPLLVPTSIFLKFSPDFQSRLADYY